MAITGSVSSVTASDAKPGVGALFGLDKAASLPMTVGVRPLNLNNENDRRAMNYTISSQGGNTSGGNAVAGMRYGLNTYGIQWGSDGRIMYSPMGLTRRNLPNNTYSWDASNGAFYTNGSNVGMGTNLMAHSGNNITIGDSRIYFGNDRIGRKLNMAYDPNTGTINTANLGRRSMRRLRNRLNQLAPVSDLATALIGTPGLPPWWDTFIGIMNLLNTQLTPAELITAGETPVGGSQISISRTLIPSGSTTPVQDTPANGTSTPVTSLPISNLGGAKVLLDLDMSPSAWRNHSRNSHVSVIHSGSTSTQQGLDNELRQSTQSTPAQQSYWTDYLNFYRKNGGVLKALQGALMPTRTSNTPALDQVLNNPLLALAFMLALSQLLGQEISPDELIAAASNPLMGQLLELLAQLFVSLVAKHGAKLLYISRLRGKCPEGQELVYFAKGGRICSACVGKKLENGGEPSYMKKFRNKQANKNCKGGKVKK